MERPTKYILRNTSRQDIMLGDLRYKIPALQTRNLLSRTAHLDWKDIEASRERGSIAVRLGKSLIEIFDFIPIDPTLPRKKIKISERVAFPSRLKKTSITLEVGKQISDELAESILADEDEFLKELEEDNLEEGNSPIMIEDEETED